MKLKSGRKIEVKLMSIDDVDFCLDIQSFRRESDGKMAVYNVSKSVTAWIRRGLKGGDFKSEINGEITDELIREMTMAERIELSELIKSHNILGE